MPSLPLYRRIMPGAHVSDILAGGCVALSVGFLLAAATVRVVASETTSLRITMLGDSLTAGYGLPAHQTLPARLQAALRSAGCDVEVVNAGVSGDTTAGGLARIDWVLAQTPHLVIIALGANDALRGLPPENVETHLNAIISRVKDRGIRPVLTGMKAPRNLGSVYTTRFDAVYPRLARQHHIPLYPFLLEGVVAHPALNLPDGVHPNAAGTEEIARRLGAFLHAILP